MTEELRGQDGARAWFAPLVPDQLLGRPPTTPAKRLMAAVLEDAVRELERPDGGWKGARARRRAEVQGWFDSEDLAWPFSFVNVCEALDLDPCVVRSSLVRHDRGPRGPVRR